MGSVPEPSRLLRSASDSRGSEPIGRPGSAAMPSRRRWKWLSRRSAVSGVEEVAAVLDPQVQAALGLGGEERQVELRRAVLEVQRSHGQHTRLERGHRGILERQERLEDR